MKVTLQYVTTEGLPSGRRRYRFRRGDIKVTLRGEPGTPEFMAHYAELLGRTDPAPSALVPQSIAWLVARYLADLEKRVKAGLSAEATLKGHRHHLGRLVERYGRKSLHMPQKALTELRDEFSDRPGAADNLLKAVSALYRWAIDRELASENPAQGIRRLRRRSGGFRAWEVQDVRRYLARHTNGVARRALILELCTAARRGDLVRLGRMNEIEVDGMKWLRWRQEKAPHGVVEVPMLPVLRDEVRGHLDGVYLINRLGRPFTKEGFGNAFRSWCNQAGVPGSLHGVRKASASLLAELGATDYEINVLLGHEMGSAESKVYTASARRRQLAVSLAQKMENVRW